MLLARKKAVNIQSYNGFKIKNHPHFPGICGQSSCLKYMQEFLCLSWTLYVCILYICFVSLLCWTLQFFGFRTKGGFDGSWSWTFCAEVNYFYASSLCNFPISWFLDQKMDYVDYESWSCIRAPFLLWGHFSSSFLHDPGLRICTTSVNCLLIRTCGGNTRFSTTYSYNLDGVNFVLNSLVYDLGQRDLNDLNESRWPEYWKG